MLHSILFTGSSGYLGGTVLAHWKETNLPPYSHLYALVRSEEQGEEVKQYGAEPLIADLDNQKAIAAKIVDLNVTIIFFLVDAYSAKYQPNMIQALGKVKAKTGHEVYFLHITGAKQFSRHAGMPTNKPLLDTNPKLYNI
ncbi:hypothetical protein BJX66DRAFT_332290 [Aspergillus keveii]|uniref:NmrA-like domain-containing protein n=1 Tax=Aspergillus keveii TaxID=714993 RepID=A0ABR4GNK6_9EURO